MSYDYYYTDGDALTAGKISSIVVTTDSGEINFNNQFDELGRLTNRDVELHVDSLWNCAINYQYEYEENSVENKVVTNCRVSNFMTRVFRTNGDYQEEYAYEEALAYDENGNIQSHSDGAGTRVYSYDDRNRLVEEIIASQNKRCVYEYDDGGNILSKKQYNNTTGALLNTDSYSYTNDKLTAINNMPITYDSYGNPLWYRGNSLTWTRGRLLSQYGSVSFQYDGDGFRRKKVNGNDTVTYYYQDGKLLAEKHSNPEKNLTFIYHNSEIVGFLKNSVDVYSYQKDALGNVIAIYDATGEKVASYTYDAWGNCTIGTNVNGIADLNPIRYRCYYYDKEIQLYYLQTRYYDPKIGRFISPDTVEYLDPESIHGLNLYAYGLNNPVMYVDPSGHFVISLGLALLIGFAVGTAVGFGATVYTDYKDDGEVFNGSVSAGEYIRNTLIGGAIGTAAAGLIYAAPSIGASIGAVFNTGSFATATGGTIAIGLTAEQLAALGLAALLGTIFFARDPYVEKLKQGMSKNQQQKFKEEIEEYKRTEGRGGADNLTKELLEEIAEMIKELFT